MITRSATNIRRLAAALTLATIGVVGSHTTPASAAPVEKVAPVATSAASVFASDFRAADVDRIALDARKTTLTDADLLEALDLDRGATIDRIRAEQEPQQAAGPYHDSTTWTWEICFSISTPSGATYEWCGELSITISTHIEGPVEPRDVGSFTTKPDVEPFELCWDETLDNGTVVEHCIEITIKTGTNSND